jgi:hypothetical protein
MRVMQRVIGEDDQYGEVVGLDGYYVVVAREGSDDFVRWHMDSITRVDAPAPEPRAPVPDGVTK